MAVKVVIKHRSLQGNNSMLQLVATVYINGGEYRVMAPSQATGDALEWLEHFEVRRAVEFNAEEQVRDEYGALALAETVKELTRQNVKTASLLHPRRQLLQYPNLRTGTCPIL